jgi:hypothetical protein
MAKVRNPRTTPPISPDDCQRLMKIADRAAAEFNGNFDELESAIGVLMLGRLMGWKPLLVIHNKRTLKKYEEILSINAREEFPEVGPLANRSVGWGVVQTLSNFWKAVNGDISVPNRRTIGKTP